MITQAIIVAAGLGKRFGSPDKVFIKIYDKPLFIMATEQFENIEEIDSIWLVARREKFEEITSYLKKFNIKKVQNIIEGGKERQDSVYNALKALPQNTDIVLIHDAARPFLSKNLIIKVLSSLSQDVDGVIPGIPIPDTVKWIKRNNLIGGTLNRDVLRAIQTPQVFWYERILSAYNRAYEDGFYGTDDASILERYGGRIILVEGEQKNIKITKKEDLSNIPNIKEERKNPFSEDIINYLNLLRIGIGYDSHRFEIGRKLILGGVEIPFEKGLAGHSDADVLTHAIIDALLGAAGFGDIGKHFPDSDPQYRGISSKILLQKTLDILKSENIIPLWIDCTIFAEKPKMKDYIPKMIENFRHLGLNVNIKAKTNEGMGFIGRQEGIAAQSICLCCKKFDLY